MPKSSWIEAHQAPRESEAFSKELEEFPFAELPVARYHAHIPMEVMIRCQNERCRLQPITKPGEAITQTSP